MQNAHLSTIVKNECVHLVKERRKGGVPLRVLDHI